MTRRLFAGGALALAAALILLPVAAMAQDATDAIAGGLSALLGPYATPVALVGAGIVAVAKLVTASTATPAPGSSWATAYWYLEKAALIFGKMKHAVVLAVAIGVAGALSACSADPAATAAKIQSYVVAYQPVASEVACAGQAAANLAAETAQQLGNDEAVTAASVASKANGIFCNGLPKGAPLPVPVAVPAPVAAPVAAAQ